MSRDLPPLNALRAFEVAARAGSFTLAASELRVSQGAISRHIAHLEAVLGIRLFERGPRDVRLTPAGLDYAVAIRACFDQVEEATHRLKAIGSGNTVAIRLFPTLAIKWLVPLLPRFRRAHPDIEVRVTTASSPSQLDSEKVDFTVQERHPVQIGLRYDPLFELAVLPVCHPDFTGGQRDLPAAAMLDYPLLHADNRPGDWQNWFLAQGIEHSVPASSLHFGNSILAQEAAAAGAGIAIAVDVYVRGDLLSGRLISPCPKRVPTGEVYYLASRRGSRERGVAIFRDWLLEAARAGAGSSPVAEASGLADADGTPRLLAQQVP